MVCLWTLRRLLTCVVHCAVVTGLSLTEPPVSSDGIVAVLLVFDERPGDSQIEMSVTCAEGRHVIPPGPAWDSWGDTEGFVVLAAADENGTNVVEYTAVGVSNDGQPTGWSRSVGLEGVRCSHPPIDVTHSFPSLKPTSARQRVTETTKLVAALVQAWGMWGGDHSVRLALAGALWRVVSDGIHPHLATSPAVELGLALQRGAPMGPVTEAVLGACGALVVSGADAVDVGEVPVGWSRALDVPCSVSVAGGVDVSLFTSFTPSRGVHEGVTSSRSNPSHGRRMQIDIPGGSVIGARSSAADMVQGPHAVDLNEFVRLPEGLPVDVRGITGQDNLEVHMVEFGGGPSVRDGDDQSLSGGVAAVVFLHPATRVVMNRLSLAVGVRLWPWDPDTSAGDCRRFDSDDGTWEFAGLATSPGSGFLCWEVEFPSVLTVDWNNEEGSSPRQVTMIALLCSVLCIALCIGFALLYHTGKLRVMRKREQESFQCFTVEGELDSCRVLPRDFPVEGFTLPAPRCPSAHAILCPPPSTSPRPPTPQPVREGASAEGFINVAQTPVGASAQGFIDPPPSSGPAQPSMPEPTEEATVLAVFLPPPTQPAPVSFRACEEDSPLAGGEALPQWVDTLPLGVGMKRALARGCPDEDTFLELTQAELRELGIGREERLAMLSKVQARVHFRQALHDAAAVNDVIRLEEMSRIEGVDMDVAVKSNRERAVHVAARHGNMEAVGLLLDVGADPSAVSSHLETPLHCAAELGHLPVIRMLVERGGDLKAVNSHHDTPLMVAAVEGNEASVQVLLEVGADVRALGGNGQSALHRACAHGHLSTVRVLVEGGADVNGVDSAGLTPLRLARSCGVERGSELVEFLLGAGAVDAPIPPQERESSESEGSVDQVDGEEPERVRSPKSVRFAVDGRGGGDGGDGDEDEDEDGDDKSIECDYSEEMSPVSGIVGSAPVAARGDGEEGLEESGMLVGAESVEDEGGDSRGERGDDDGDHSGSGDDPSGERGDEGASDDGEMVRAVNDG